MATYFVASSGSNTSPYDTWAKAATSLQTALTAASTSGDIVVLKYNGVPSGDAEVAANTTWTFSAKVYLICASADDAGTAYTPTAMGSSYWIGNSTTIRNISLAGAFAVAIFGLTIRTVAGIVSVNTSDGGQFNLDQFLLWNSSTTSTTSHALGNSANASTYFINSSFRHDRSATNTDTYSVRGYVEFTNCTWVVTGSPVHAAIFVDPGTTSSQIVKFHGCDFSQYGSGATLVADNTRTSAEFSFIQSKLPASAVVLATQTTVPNKASATAIVYDCASGDTHGLFGYYDALGSLVSDQTVYFTSGAAGQSWKITTTGNASFANPFVSPWVSLYHTGTSAITPYLEVGGTATLNDDQVWAEFAAKVTSGTTKASFYNDKRALTAAAAAQTTGAGTGSWSGGTVTWSGKIDSSSSLTPAESGHLMARAKVGAPSITVYVDPQIRT